MAHSIRTFIAPAELGRELARHHDAWCVDVTPSLTLVPLTTELADRIGQGTPLPPFDYLTPSMLERARDFVGTLAYIETDYFGGSGYQRAGAWTRDSILVEPHERSGAVNAALRALGVIASAGRDEWDTIGLTAYRGMDDLRRRAVR